MWGARYASGAILEEFLMEHNAPGVLDVQGEKNTILVFFDRNKLKSKSIPSFFRGCSVSLFDVRQTIFDAKFISKKMREKNLTVSHKKVYDHFNDTIELCQRLLKSKKNEVSNPT